MANFNITRLTALPTTRTANTVYLIGPPDRPAQLEMYVTGNDAATIKRILTQTDIQAMIDASAVSGGSGSTIVVNDIAARDALTLTENAFVFVVDASADTTVASGGATYVYRQSNTSFTKISEAESLDITLSYNNITGRPTATPGEIDAAVAAAHTHANKTQLDLIGQNGDGNLTYNSALPVIAWTETSW